VALFFHIGLSVTLMTIRITEIRDQDGTVLQVDGRLLSDTVDELTRAAAAAARPLTLDLSGVLFVDARSVEVLQEIGSEGATFQGVPPYVQLLLHRSCALGD